MFTAAKPSATSATRTRTQGATFTTVNTVNIPAMNSAYTRAVTKMKTRPTITVFRREPDRRVRASSTESTHSEHGLKPSTSAMSAVVTMRDWWATSTRPKIGRSMVPGSGSGSTTGGVGEALGAGAVGSAVSTGDTMPAPASGHPEARHVVTAASSCGPVTVSENPTQYSSPMMNVGTPVTSNPVAAAMVKSNSWAAMSL